MPTSSFHLAEASLDFALANVLHERGDNNLLPIPHEYDAIRLHWGDVKAFYASRNLLN